MKVEQEVRVGGRRIRAGQEGLHKGLEEGGRMDQEVLVVVDHIHLAEAGMRLGVEGGMLRVGGNPDQEGVREEDRQEEDSGRLVVEGNILPEEGRLEEDVRIPAEGREAVLEEDSQREALQSVHVNMMSESEMLGGLLTGWGSIV